MRAISGRILIKGLISLSLVVFLAYRIDAPDEFIQVLASASLPLLILAILLFVGSVFVSVARWKVILENFNIYPRFLPLVRINFIGHFFNLFLPTGIGGDFFRAYYLGKKEQRGMSTTLMTTFLERNAGLCALLFIGTLAAAIRGIQVRGLSLFYLLLLMATLYSLANLALFHSWTHQKINFLLKRWRWEKIEARVELVYRGLHSLRENRKAIILALFLSLLIQFLSVVIVWVVGRAIDIQAPFSILLVFIPIVNLSTMIPVTINGIGLRESLYYLLFREVGVSGEIAVALSLLNLAVYIVGSLPGGILYSFYKREEHCGQSRALTVDR